MRRDYESLHPADQRFLEQKCDWSALRRSRNAIANACINENKRGTHGPRTHGVRCERCYQVHSGSRKSKATQPFA